MTTVCQLTDVLGKVVAVDDVHASAGAVTIRQLARETSAVIEWVRERGRPMLVTRNGIPVAMIQSLEFDAWSTQARPAGVLSELEEPEIDWEALDLGDRERLVLPNLADTFHVYDLIRDAGLSPGEASISCGYLEIKRLSSKTLMGYRLTELGRRVQRALQRESAAATGEEV